MKRNWLLSAVMLVQLLHGAHFTAQATGTEPAEHTGQPGRDESALLSNIRQLTFAGRRAGEGYFNGDATKLIFQSEREPGNPFFQIYLMDLETGDTQRISPGVGKTTCAWIHPDGHRVLYASTHGDPAARQKQQEELELRADGKERRYAWDYDDNFELYEFDRRTGESRQLTASRGYDAEGSWSPDGRKIAFASTRGAYQGQLSPADQQQRERDPSYFADIYIMNSDGSDVRQLTNVAGYDGGPFFSPDGGRICWRRFSEDGATAEIYTMKIDGTDVRQLTRMGAMSWGPFYHPSGKYLIFSTNLHGFGNFELYLVDADARSQPVRVTFTEGFDGLPVFTPDGGRISWTSNRTSSGNSQIFIADWDHRAALRLLGLDVSAAAEPTGEVLANGAGDAARQSVQATSSDFRAADILRHVDYLCRPELAGRLTGTPGEKLATAYVAAYMDALGLEPAGDNGSFFQEFDFTMGVALGSKNALRDRDRSYRVDADWRPLAFSATGEIPESAVVFAGYAITADAGEGEEEYDSFVHLDVRDKWVLAFRYMPEDVTPERRQHLSRFTSLRFKAMRARDLGARGLIIVSGPNSGVKSQLVPLRFDGSLSGSSVLLVSVTNDVAGNWLAVAGHDLKKLQDKLDTGEPVMGFELPDVRLSAVIDIERIKQTGRNVLGMLPATTPSDESVIVGAHVDHLGRGSSASSLARDDEIDQIHAGADDNASGVAAMLEMAQYLAAQTKQGKLQPRRNVLFAAWSGEELGLLGASHFAKRLIGRASHNQAADEAHSSDPNVLYPRIAACLNLDMVGRLDKKLILQGVGSSSVWPEEIERRNVPVGLPVTMQKDSYLPTDSSVFFMRGVPSLAAFTGSHAEYHTPRDTPDTLNYEGAADVARLMALVTRSLVTREEAPKYVPQQRPEGDRPRARMRAYLGTIPDYAESDVQGVKLSGVANNGPASQAGVQGGDVIVELAGRKIENIYDYTYAIEALKIGQPVKMIVLRGEERKELEVTPGSRE